MIFDQMESAARAGGLPAALQVLIELSRAEKKYPVVFEARLMARRAELGLPLAGNVVIEELPEDQRRGFETAFVEAAREVGGLFLADGDIARAWPYFRAVGDATAVAEAIEQVEPREDLDAILHIALQEGVNPRRGFELLLAQHGICRAITFFDQYPDRKTRPACLALVVRTLYQELVASVKRSIERVEGAAPQDGRLPALIAGREWLFEGSSYHVDTSHLISVIRFSLEARDRETLEFAREMAEYGTHLAEMLQYRIEPPFDSVYLDHKTYLDALLGEGVDPAVAHFRSKLTEENTVPAQVLVALLVRLERYTEAIEISRAWLAQVEPNELACPSIFELCERAGDRALLAGIARERGDALSFAVALRGDKL